MSELKPLKVLICDDIEEIRNILKRLVESQDGFEVCAVAADGNEAMELFAATRPDIVTLDVDMPGKSGVEVASFIHDIDPRVHIIFATAHANFMDKAFDVYAFDYWIKPFSRERVLTTLRKIRDLHTRLDTVTATPAKSKSELSRIMIKKKDVVMFLDMSDIILIQREDRSTVIYTAYDSHTTGDSLSAIEKKLDPRQFFRSHKSYIVNMSYIDSVTPYGRWTYAIKFRGIKNDALITSDKLDELKEFFN